MAQTVVRKIELDKIVDILLKIKDDDFYFKCYAKDIIKSYIKQQRFRALRSAGIMETNLLT